VLFSIGFSVNQEMPTPSELRWGSDARQLPARRLTVRGAPTGQAVDFAAVVRNICFDLKTRTQWFAHIDPDAMAYTYTTSRIPSKHGLLARLTPMRFNGGAETKQYRGTLYRPQKFFINGREMLYLVTFCMPRFLDLPFLEKLTTIIHELYHISPKFDGDLRRHDGRCQYHTASKKEYDQLMATFAHEYLKTDPDPTLLTSLHSTFAELCAAHGGVLGIKLPRPQMVPVLQLP
jgi:hypothetical protein